jgi:hypothetical protein
LRPLRRFFLGGIFVHFFLIAAGALGDVAWFVANGYTALAVSSEGVWKKVGWFTDAAAGRTLPVSNLFRQSLTTYLHCTGIDGGYAFFAPGVPNSYKVVFEIHYPSGEIEYELPHITRSATSVRLSTVLHNIGRANNDALREVMLKMLTSPIAQEHPTATTIRTIFGYIQEPTVADARKGKKESYEVMYVYDFTLPSLNAQQERP